MKYQLIANTFYIGKTKNDHQFLIDKDDYELISKYSWTKNGDYFVAYDKNLKKNIYLHRLVMNVHEDRVNRNQNVIHHVNHDTNDNRKNNLKQISHKENLRLRNKNKNNTSGYQGVSYNRQKSRWQALITKDNRLIMLGMFKTIEEAVQTRKQAEQLYW